MKLECNKAKLEYALQRASRIANKHLTLPVLSCVYIETKDTNKLIIHSTNLDIGIEIEASVKVVEGGKIAVPAQVFLGTLSSIKEADIKIETNEHTLTISSVKTSVVIKCMSHEDFPSIPTLQPEKIIKIKSKDLISGFKSVWYSASLSTIKPELSSILMYAGDNGIVFVSTDSFRLAEKKVHTQVTLDIPQVLIPSKNVAEIIKLFEDVDDEISIVFEKNQAAFISKETYLVSRLVDGSFPDYKQIIPKSFSTTVTLLKNDFINSIKASNIFSDSLHQVRVKVDTEAKTLSIESKNNDVGEYKESVKATVVGDSLELNFNNKYIIDCMQSITSDSITLQFGGIGKPLIIQGVSDNGFMYIVMPMNR